MQRTANQEENQENPQIRGAMQERMVKAFPPPK